MFVFSGVLCCVWADPEAVGSRGSGPNMKNHKWLQDSLVVLVRTPTPRNNWTPWSSDNMIEPQHEISNIFVLLKRHNIVLRF